MDDLYQEARAVAVRCYLEKWDPSRAAFITLAYLAVDNHLRTTVQFWRCPKRNQGVQVELEHVEWEQKYRANDLSVDAVLQFMVHEC